MNYFVKIGAVAGFLGLLLSVVALVGGNQPVATGASGTRFPNGLSTDSTSPVAGEVRTTDLTVTDDVVVTDDMTVSGGSFNLATSNTATSSAIIGCVQQYATSTATAWKFVIVASSTQMAPGYNGLVYANYGTCP